MSRQLKPKEFIGLYKEVFDGYRRYKQSMGYSFNPSEFYYLKKLNILLNDRYSSEITLKRSAILDFLSLFEELGNNTRFKIQGYLRGLAKYMKSCGYEDVYYIPDDLMIKEDFSFVPYIFTKEEISRIFNSVDSQKRIGWSRCDKIFYQVIYRLLYATGMRVSEAIKLKVEDVDLQNDIITVHNGKDHVSRLIPFLPSLRHWLIRHREEHSDIESEYFFPHKNGEIRNRMCVSNNFIRKVLPGAGINPDRGNSHNIRVHDLRHTFACHSLDKAIKQGRDPFCVLPYLSTYMGHIDVKSTEIYLRLTDAHYEEIIEANHYLYEGLGDYDD